MESGTSYFSDDHLLIGLAKGESKATAFLYRKYRKPILLWLRTRGCDEHDAEDIFQEAILVLYSKAQEDAFRLQCQLSTYLLAVAKHIWLKKNRQQQKQSTDANTDLVEQNADLIVDEDVEYHQERELLFTKMAAALDTLGSPCNALLKAFYYQKKSMQQITVEMGYSNMETTKNLKYKCLNRLKKIFNNP